MSGSLSHGEKIQKGRNNSPGQLLSDKKLKALYESGLSMQAIGRQFNTSGHTVSAKLRKLKVTLRSHSVTTRLAKGNPQWAGLSDADLASTYLAKISSGMLAKRYGVCKSTVCRRLRKMEVPARSASENLKLRYLRSLETGAPWGRPRQYTLDQSFFDEITPASAYVLGLIQADGTIGPDRFSITASIKARKYLTQVRSLLGSDRPLQKVEHELGTVLRLCVNSTPMTSKLRHWGIHSPRTWTAYTHSDFQDNRDYWRGFMDGDGTLGVYPSSVGNPRALLQVVGSEQMCQDFLAFSRRQGCGFRVRVRPHVNIFIVRLNGKEAVRVAEVLYQDSAFSMRRKQVRFWKMIAHAKRT